MGCSRLGWFTWNMFKLFKATDGGKPGLAVMFAMGSNQVKGLGNIEVTKEFFAEDGVVTDQSNAKGVRWKMIGFSEEKMRNQFFLRNWQNMAVSDKRAKSILADFNHKGETGEMKFLTSTFMSKMKLTLSEAGFREMECVIESTNEQVVAESENITGISLVLEPDNWNDWKFFEWDEDEYFIFAKTANIRSFALLLGITPGSGGTGIMEQEYFSTIKGSTAVPNRSGDDPNSQSFSNNNNETDMTKEEITQIATEAAAAVFAAEQAKNKIQIEIDKSEFKAGTVVESNGKKLTLMEVPEGSDMSAEDLAEAEKQAQMAEDQAAAAAKKSAAMRKAFADAANINDKNELQSGSAKMSKAESSLKETFKF